jgi:hypothetical protein
MLTILWLKMTEFFFSFSELDRRTRTYNFMAEFFLRRIRTQYFMNENYRVCHQENSFLRFYNWIPRRICIQYSKIWWVTNSPELVPQYSLLMSEYEFSSKNCTQVLLLKENSHPIFWERVLIGMTSPDTIVVIVETICTRLPTITDFMTNFI